MPIKKIRRQDSRRLKPVRFFEGTLTNARRTPVKRVVSALKSSGVEFQDERQARKVAERLKKAAIRRIEDLKAGGASQHIFSLNLPNGAVDFRVTRSPKGRARFVLHQNPVMHGIRPRTQKIDSFGILEMVLSRGFKSKVWPNVERVYSRGAPSSWATPNLPYPKSIKSIAGDRYTIYTMAPMTRAGEPEQGGVERFGRDQVLRIVVEHPKGLPKSVMSRKKGFYRRKFRDIPFTLVQRS